MWFSASRVGPTRFIYGIDMTAEMRELADANKAEASVENVESLEGTIEDVPLSDASVDVVSNYAINLSTDKPAVLARCCASSPRGGRIAVSDLVAEDHLTPAKHDERGSDVGCIAAALLKSEYLDGSAAAGFTDAELEFTHEAAPRNHSAIVRATEQQSRDCAETEQQASNVSKGSYGRFWPRFSVRHAADSTGQDGTPLLARIWRANPQAKAWLGSPDRRSTRRPT